MNRSKLILTLLLSILSAGFATSHAQSAPVVVTVNVNQAAQAYYKVVAFLEELRASEEQAKQKLAVMNEEGKSMLAEMQQLAEQAQSEILSETAREEAKEDLFKKRSEAQGKEAEIRQFMANTQKSFAARERTQMTLYFKEINEVIQELAKERGATLVLDVSGQSQNGLPSVLYSDPAYNITEQVVERINADQESVPAAE